MKALLIRYGRPRLAVAASLALWCARIFVSSFLLASLWCIVWIALSSALVHQGRDWATAALEAFMCMVVFSLLATLASLLLSIPGSILGVMAMLLVLHNVKGKGML